MEVLLLTYIVRRVPAHTVQQEHQFGSATITDWAKLCREVMSPATVKICDITYYIATKPLHGIHGTLRYFRLGLVSFRYVTSMAPPGMLRHFHYPHKGHISPTTLSFYLHISPSPLLPVQSNRNQKIAACGVCTNTDDGLRSFVVLRATSG